MPTLTISLPDSLKAFIDEQVEQGGYGSVSEYLRCLVRDDRKRLDEARLETLLLEGIESGSTEMTAETWDAIRQAVANRRAAKSNIKS
jgi:antitoxin ParD1/3/4